MYSTTNTGWSIGKLLVSLAAVFTAIFPLLLLEYFFESRPLKKPEI